MKEVRMIDSCAANTKRMPEIASLRIPINEMNPQLISCLAPLHPACFVDLKEFKQPQNRRNRCFADTDPSIPWWLNDGDATLLG
jgi:hypothetical protein